MADESGPLLSHAADREPTPWKNGLGSATEVASSPAGAGVDDFDWRVSIATISADSAFSSYEGVDRHIMPLSATGLVLDENGKRRELAQFEVLGFAGETPVEAIEVGVETTDLNLMVRRGIRSGSLEKRAVTGSAVLTTDEDTELVIVVLEGELSLPDAMVTGDALVVGPDDFLMLAGTATIAVATIG